MVFRARRNHKPGVPARVVQAPSESAKEIFLRVFRAEGREDVARRRAEVTFKDVERWRSEDAEFDVAYQECDRLFVEKMEGLGFDMARNGDGAMVRFFLQSRCPEKYGNKAKLDVNIRDVTKLSDEELEAHIAQLQGKKA